MPYIGNTGGVLAGGTAAIKYTNTATMTVARVGTAWRFSLTNISPEIQRLIEDGYTVTLHYIAYVPGQSRTDSNRLAKNSDTKYIYTNWKSNRHIDITLQVNSTPTSFYLTQWFDEALTMPFNKEMRTKAIQLDYDDYGVWYRRFKLAIEVNNLIYIVTPEHMAYYYCPPGTPISVDLALSDTDGNDFMLYE